MSNAPVFVKVNSHRAGERLRRLLGVDRLDYHYTMKTGGCLVPIPGEMVEAARRIPSLTVARLTDTPRRCW